MTVFEGGAMTMIGSAVKRLKQLQKIHYHTPFSPFTPIFWSSMKTQVSSSLYPPKTVKQNPHT